MFISNLLIFLYHEHIMTISSVPFLRPIIAKKDKFSTLLNVAILGVFSALPYVKMIDFHDNPPIDPNLKYILFWTPWDWAPFYYFEKGQESFKNNKCEFTNCFVTANRDILGNLTNFHAIAFNGRNMMREAGMKPDLPQLRSPHQKYIYFNTESSVNEKICNPWYEGFFNWTCSYKLNSDIGYPYLTIKDINGIVGPRVEMNWITDMKEIDEEFKEKLKSKKKAAAWFVSNCKTESKRELYVKALQLNLLYLGKKIYIYGACGQHICKRNDERCNDMISRDYYFYLAFENSFAEDYVTEKLLTALNNNAVPIVFGGANYTRFLPPGSYINARAYTPKALAIIMADIIATPSKYHDFFRWTNHYSYSDAFSKEDVCNVCAALNDEKKLKHSSYTQFRSWWNPKWEEKCQMPSVLLKDKKFVGGMLLRYL